MARYRSLVVRGEKRVTVEFAPGALVVDTTVTITEPARYDPTGQALTGAASNDAIRITLLPHIASFGAPVTLTVDLSGFLTAEQWAAGMRPGLHFVTPAVATEAPPCTHESPTATPTPTPGVA